VPTVLKSGSLNLLEPSGPVQACNGIALPLPFTIHKEDTDDDDDNNNNVLIRKTAHTPRQILTYHLIRFHIRVCSMKLLCDMPLTKGLSRGQIPRNIVL